MRPEDAETPQPDNADLLDIAMRAIVGPDNVLRGSLRAGVCRALAAVIPLIEACEREACISAVLTAERITVAGVLRVTSQPSHNAKRFAAAIRARGTP